MRKLRQREIATGQTVVVDNGKYNKYIKTNWVEGELGGLALGVIGSERTSNGKINKIV